MQSPTFFFSHGPASTLDRAAPFPDSQNAQPIADCGLRADVQENTPEIIHGINVCTLECDKPSPGVSARAALQAKILICAVTPPWKAARPCIDAMFLPSGRLRRLAQPRNA